jgi:glycosyltransferase involved in cell wall biosynthesis
MSEDKIKIRKLIEDGIFDAESYVTKYPDVTGSGIGPYEHYVKYGKLLRRQQTNQKVHLKSTALESPKVTVICTTYNHEKFIRDTLTGFCIQKSNFDIEFLIGDDSSSDKTSEIIREFHEKDPRIIPVIRENNLGPGANFVDLAAQARGIYVAICEGDDYWTDPQKLQKQVDFLDNNPEFSIVFHPVTVIHEDENIEDFVFPENLNGPIHLDQLVQGNFIQTNSVLYRWRFPGGMPKTYNENVVPADWFLHLLHAEWGRIFCLPDIMGVYRKHAAGMWSQIVKNQISHRKKFANREIDFFRESKRLFNGVYENIQHQTMTAVFHQLFEHLLSTKDFSGIYDLVNRNLDIAFECLSERGFEISAEDLISDISFSAKIVCQHKVSVVVTSFNQEKYIEECLEGILNQEYYADIEIIIGDDGSKDGTAEIILDYAKRFPDQIRIAGDGKNRGMLQNLKRCFNLCTGSFIAICEGDDYWISKKKLYKQVKQLSSSKEYAMSFNWLLLNNDIDDSFVPHYEQSNLLSGPVKFDQLVSAPYTANFSCCLYRTSAIRSVPDSYYNFPGAADWLFNLYIARNGKVCFLKELLSVYRLVNTGQWSGMTEHQKADTINKSKITFKNIFNIKDDIFDHSIKPEINIHHECGATVRAHLDKLVIENEGFGTLFLLGGGWAFSTSSKEIKILVSTETDSFRITPEIRRTDVIASARSSGLVSYRSDECGFSFKIPVRFCDKIKINFEIDDIIIQWKEVSFIKSDSAF